MRPAHLILGFALGLSGAHGAVVLLGMALSPMVRDLFAEAGGYGLLVILWSASSAAALVAFVALVLGTRTPRAETLGAGGERTP